MVTKYINEQDKKNYFNFTNHHFKLLVTTKNDSGKRKPIQFKPIFHYTSGENLIKILKNKSIWMTQIACLNDTKELMHAVDLLEATIDFEIKKENENENNYLPLFKKMSDILKTATPDAMGVFVSCFSERSDDLSQWRAYGGPNGGYSLEFNTELLLDLAAERETYLVPVTYDRDSKDILMNDILKWTKIFFDDGIKNNRAPTTEEWISEFSFYWIEQLSILAPLLKHDAFKDESEWRLIYRLKDSDVQNMEFSESPSMMRRHLPFKLGQASSETKYHSLISSIMVGPKSHQNLSRIAIGDLLKSSNYPENHIKLNNSSIPFRNTT